eukprot:477258_1
MGNYYSNKLKNKSQQDEYDHDDDDFEEVCVTGNGDKRLAIYETANKNDVIIGCIGHLRVTYDDSIDGGYVIGTGTIFHVEDSKCLVLTCSHNIRRKIYHCKNTNCKGRLLTDGKCKICNGPVVRKQQLHRAVRGTFVRWGVTKHTSCYHEAEYECDMKQCIINDEEYSKYPHPASGNDFAILV